MRTTSALPTTGRKGPRDQGSPRHVTRLVQEKRDEKPVEILRLERTNALTFKLSFIESDRGGIFGLVLLLGVDLYWGFMWCKG